MAWRRNIALTKRLVTQSFCLVPQAIGGKTKLLVQPATSLCAPMLLQEPARKVVGKYRLWPLLFLLLTLPLTIGCFCANCKNPNHPSSVVQDRRTRHARCGDADRQLGSPDGCEDVQGYLTSRNWARTRPHPHLKRGPRE